MLQQVVTEMRDKAIQQHKKGAAAKRKRLNRIVAAVLDCVKRISMAGTKLGNGASFHGFGWIHQGRANRGKNNSRELKQEQRVRFQKKHPNEPLPPELSLEVEVAAIPECLLVQQTNGRFIVGKARCNHSQRSGLPAKSRVSC